nr:PKD domain-containing protein [Zobellia nedashkovskayae]
MNITPKRTLSYFLCFIGITFLLNLACSKDADTLRDVVINEENSPVIKQEEPTNNPDIPQIEDSVVVETEIRTAILYPIHDAYIQNGKGYDESIIRLEEEERTSYLMFDFSPLDSIGGSISTATLMFVINTYDGSGEVDVYKGESSDWLETELSEKSAPEVGELIGVTKQDYIIDTEVSIDLEVEALDLEPFTFILDHKDGDHFAFASKENKTQEGSSLIVVYEVAVGADDIDLYIVEPEEVISDTDIPIEEEEGTNEVIRDDGDGSEEETPSNEEEEVTDSVEEDAPASEEVAEENENTDTEEEVVAEEQETDSEEGVPSNEEEVVVEVESPDSVEEEPEEVTPTTEEAEPKTEEETPVNEVPEDNTDTNIDPLPSSPFPTNESPVAVANGSPINGEAPLKVSFNAIDSSDDKAIVSYVWNFKDGQTASTVDTEHTFVEAGNYEVTLLVKDEEGISALDVIIIKVTGPENTAPVAKISSNKISGTVPLEVAFTGSGSTDDTGITGYSWDFKDGNGSDQSDASHTFETAGIYEVELTVTDAEGLTNTETVSITVESKENTAPVAKASADKTSGTLPLAVAFTGSGSTDDTGITGYSWDFKDGNGSDQSDASHTFETAGTYAVELTVTDAEGLTNTETVSITVESKENTAPVAKVSADKTSGTVALEVAFTGSGSTDDTGITGYSWDFKDGNGSDQSNASHTFETAGIYAVELTVTDAEGLTNTETVSVIVEEQESGPEEDNTDTNIDPLPSSPFPTNESPVAVANGSPINGEAPLKVSFNAIDSSDDKAIVSYVWNFKDGQTASTVDTEHTFVEAGNYEVTLLVKDEEGISALDVIIIKVTGPENTAPVAKISSNKISGTVPLEVAFTGSGSTDDTGITGYSWDFKDGNGSDQSDASHTFETAGIYEVELTVTDAEGLTNTETVSITVESKENTAPVAKASADKTSGTLPLAVAFTGSGSTDDTGITGYSWDFKDGNGSDQSDASHTFETAGTYAVELTVTDAEGLTNTETVSITVESKENTAPVAKISSNKTSGTVALEVAFTGSGSTDDTGITGYSWDFKDGNGSDQSDASHTFETAGIYRLPLRAADQLTILGLRDIHGTSRTETVRTSRMHRIRLKPLAFMKWS